MISKLVLALSWMTWVAGTSGVQLNMMKISLGELLYYHNSAWVRSGAQLSLSVLMNGYSPSDVSFTRAPNWIKIYPGEANDKHMTFSSLVALAFPDIGKQEQVPPRLSPSHQLSLPPDDHMLCYDYLYYVCALRVGRVFTSLSCDL